MVEKNTPLIIRAAMQAVRKNPGLSDAEIQSLIDRTNTDEMVRGTLADIESAKLAKKRNRKSKPDIIRRKAKICDMRNKDPKKWTQGKLAKKFKLKSADNVKKILKQEAKWRRDFNELGTE